MNLTKQLLMSSAYWVLNKSAVKMLGIETAFLLSSMVEAESLMADKEGWFYQTSDTVEEITTLSRHKQDQCIKKLEELKIIEKDVRGMPPKRYFRINYVCLTNQFVNFQQINMQKANKSICKKSATNKEHINKELNHKESIKKNSASNDTQHTPDVKDEELSKKKKDKQLREEHFEKMWKLYPVKKGKGQVSDSKKKEIFKVGDEFARCISRYKKQVEAERKDGFKELRFQQGSTFFNSGYVDYLDENYEGGELDGRSNGSSREIEEEFAGECEGDRLYERARRKFDIKPIPDEEIPF